MTELSVIRSIEVEDPGQRAIEKMTETETIGIVIEDVARSVVHDLPMATEKMTIQHGTVEDLTTLHDEGNDGHGLDLDLILDRVIALRTGTRTTTIGNATGAPLGLDADAALLHQLKPEATKAPDAYDTHHQPAKNLADIWEHAQKKLQTPTQNQTPTQIPPPTQIP